MGSFDVSGSGLSPAGGQSIGTIANISGAAVSLVLIVGIGVWGYQMLSRDVTGVPVVRAAEGAMRITPDNPGGRPAANQGLAVNQVAGQGAAEAPADRVVLAPRTVGLNEEDQPPQTTSQSGGTASILLSDTRLSQSQGEADIVSQIAPSEAVDLQALADQIAAVGSAATLSAGEGAQPLPVRTNLTGAEAEETAQFPGDQSADVQPDLQGLVRSLRPQMRPEGVRLAANTPLESLAASDQSELDIDPATIPAGTRLAQLGAFESPEIARQQWTQLSSRFDEYLVDKKRVIQRASSGGRIFYRLRAMGFADLDDARRFCSALKSQGTDCIPVETR